ncbi:hypothetical protein CMV_002335 [Castanea mollissima]|uniref:O-methyltransferase C-terminal domain-containing protein n=1 Tax=Castanea mollissima TaxID=60419 RepID=A0A8J4VXL9_9ROSI|nr:hypothetical protein CMV_002335 [Castanea mollissima]
MRSLVRKNILTAHNPSDDGDITLYGLTPASKWLLHDAELSLVPVILMESHPWLLAPWHYLSQCVIEGADAMIIKWVLHNWSDEHCIKILRNCRKAISEKIGKVIIIDIILEKDNNDLFDETRMVFDLLMITLTLGGKERTELEWKKLLEEGGFPRYKIIKIPTMPSIIEAYPM